MTPETDYRMYWVVMIGSHYVAGLGQTYKGFQNGSEIPVVPGIVITRLESRAMRFTSGREAGALARQLGGQVLRA